jgi:hypothetical protein
MIIWDLRANSVVLFSTPSKPKLNKIKPYTVFVLSLAKNWRANSVNFGSQILRANNADLKNLAYYTIQVPATAYVLDNNIYGK